MDIYLERRIVTKARRLGVKRQLNPQQKQQARQLALLTGIVHSWAQGGSVNYRNLTKNIATLNELYRSFKQQKMGTVSVRLNNALDELQSARQASGRDEKKMDRHFRQAHKLLQNAYQQLMR